MAPKQRNVTAPTTWSETLPGLKTLQRSKKACDLEIEVGLCYV